MVARTVVIAALLVLAGCGASASQPNRPVAVAAIAAIEVATDLDGSVVGALPASQHATVAIVFASWCIHCRDEMPVLAELRIRHPEVRILGINYRAHEEYDGRGNAAAVREFVSQRAPWLRVVPAGERVWASLGRPTKVPSLFVFDASGTLVRGFDRRVADVPTLAELEAALPPP
jgi:thiol-disulfide isomerase/thioredoxin